MNKKRLELQPNAAGRHAYARIKKIAQGMVEEAREITDAYIRQNIPGAETIAARYEGGKYIRTIESADGQRVEIGYDYRKETVSTLTNETEGGQCRELEYAGSAIGQ
jgi:hypothetical protein